MKPIISILVLVIGISLMLYTHNSPVALDHVRVDISKFEDEPHAR